jgi:hypothetical protein
LSAIENKFIPRVGMGQMQKKSSHDCTRESVMVEHNLPYQFVSLRGRFKGRVPIKERGVTLHKEPECINWGYLFCFILISWGASQVQLFFSFFAMSQFDWPIAKKS